MADRADTYPEPPWFGPYGRGAIAYAARFAEIGANACWFHMFDAEAFAACEQYGLAACVEFKTFRADFKARPELIPLGVDGQPIRFGRLVQGVCLSQADFLAEVEDQLLAGLRQFQPAGIWLDYLTYAGWFETPTPDLQESCFCAACIADFCERRGVDATTPQQILAQHAAAWQEHKCQRIAEFALHYSNLIRQQQPNCVVGAYMCPWLPAEFDGALTRIFAQDYQRLAAAIDVFTPLIYAQKSGRPPEWGREFLAAAPEFVPADRRVQLILDVLDFPASLEALVGAEPQSWGIQLYGGAELFQNPAWMTDFRRVVEKIQAQIA